MEFNLLTIIGIILISSSFISLVLLLRKNIKQCVKSFIFILILSDVLSNIFIGVILLAKQKNPAHLNEQETESGILRDNNNDKNENEYNNYLLINKCDFKSLLMNYAVFLVPFVNNFMSLLTKSFYCNYNIECIKKKYKQLILSKLISTDLSTVERRRSRLSLFKYLNNNNNNNNIFSIISVISQWIIPILSMMILYLTGYENITTDIRSYELTCIHMTNFPFDNCYNDNNNNNNNNNNSNKLEEEFNPLEEMDSIYSINMMNSTDYLLPDNKLDAIESVTSNGSETNEIVTKIQEIVQSVLNNSESIPDWYFSKILPLKKLNSSRSRSTKGRKVDIDYDMFEDELTSACMSDNKCFISPNVLKMNMIIVIFIVYFGSILLSTVYCIKSNYICSNIKQQLVTVESMSKVTGNNKFESNVKDKKLNDQGGSSDSIKWINSNIDLKSVAGVIKEETSEIEKIIYISVISLLLAVLLWTPVFMQLIAKVFMCMEMSYWSMNVFYFTAMGYGVIRNFLDVDMVKTKRIVPQVLSDSC